MNDQNKSISRRVFLSLLGLAVTALPAYSQGLVTFEKTKLVIKSSQKLHSFVIEMAISNQQQAQGLMYRRSMPADAGMLFDYGSLQPIRMWMKNTYIPLDMIFIGQDGKIINIAERAIPHSQSVIASKGRARAVLEVNGGTASRLGLNPGDQVLHPIFCSKP
jgi:uncharacterized protein